MCHLNSVILDFICDFKNWNYFFNFLIFLFRITIWYLYALIKFIRISCNNKLINILFFVINKYLVLLIWNFINYIFLN